MNTESLKETARLEAFSDAVFAIAITLLALELKVPHQGDSATGPVLAAALAQQWPSYMAFVCSFLSILAMWVNHHRIFDLIRGGDGWLMLTNGLLLLIVTAVPFPTTVLADYFATGASEVACAAYAGFYVLVSVAFNLLWFSAARRGRLLRPDFSDDLVRAIGRRLLIGLPAYLAATVLAFWSAPLSLAICSLLWIHWALLDRIPARGSGVQRATASM